MSDDGARTLAEILAGLVKLRAPFPADQIGKLPKPYNANADKGTCRECGGWHGLPAAHLDFVGHADLTARLLDADPFWSWEPFAVDDHGLPAIVGGNLWVRLTVCGVTRIGVGDGRNAKECIGDALRNAAMRFGAALELWAKGDRDYTAAGGAGAASQAEQQAVAVQLAPHQLRVRQAVGALAADERSAVMDFVQRSGLPRSDAMDEDQAQRVMDFIESPA